MDLFNTSLNILPFDGEVDYYGSIIDLTRAQYYLEKLMHRIDWDYDKAIIYGKLIITKRKVAWYGDQPFEYTYSKTTKSAIPWTKELLELKEIVELKTGESFNSCLLNLYHTGEEGMAWHSDGEVDLKKNGAIASLSLGAERKFSFKHKTTKHSIAINLEKGSLLVMKGVTQTHWLHRLPPSKKVKTPRINLTFRTIEPSE
ncbi:alpha-ketoglutarate-dependent dioxygenase AlkB [Aquimarina sp. RZ0]|uniref:alpha-ketoglutarate-dependent dioxygenase AlkB family protein n=1 Tax=Aquimarina sp. RZ0 TaxID=2607730 RepID=UPI0011F33676|nr:alpha-ketoglutarate-dependent dioxygenase AlkB [Aquimarina sp. RZ0]KAA1243265.1 alpha-ketoglutarate-dependent dioxygenase AlkB [Aquimarina sp. RZ0]